MFTRLNEMGDVFWVAAESYSFLLIISRAFIFKSVIPSRMGQRGKTGHCVWIQSMSVLTSVCLQSPCASLLLIPS